jgi:hypothetical protein
MCAAFPADRRDCPRRAARNFGRFRPSNRFVRAPSAREGITNSKWLSSFAHDVHSQNGEDGIIGKILELLGSTDRWCVEFGAWDGEHLSNTYNLIANHGFSAVLIEGSAARFSSLVDRHRANPNVLARNAFVGFAAHDGLDSILASTPIPVDFDVLSIDIDGNDYHAWKAVTRYRPKLVVIEYNPTIPSAVEFVQQADMAVNHGSSILSMTLLAKQKGYELVAATDYNCFFVAEKYFPRFGIADNSVEAIRPSERLVSYIFNGFDGTVFVRGYRKVEWHGVPYVESRMQHIPRLLRRFPDTYGPVMKRVAKYYRSITKRLHG